VSWPLDLIVNTDALKKYNQVLSYFLLQVPGRVAYVLMPLIILLLSRSWDSY
jgi:hypothetical protein